MVIYAPNVHIGGGKVLLLSLLKSMTEPCTVIADSRLDFDEKSNPLIKVISVKPTIISRLRAEFLLQNMSLTEPHILCFGNLPPLFKTKNKVYLFFQNTILLKKYSHFDFSFPVKIKHQIERWWLHWGISNVKTVFVQSPQTQIEFNEEFSNIKVLSAPFAPPFQLEKIPKPNKYDFIYVASGDPHKNHKNLFLAWKILADCQLFPSLVLTITEAQFEQLQSKIGTAKNIFNLSNLNHQQTLDLYPQSKALIFPSLTESFGLPLIEAQAKGLDIVASELDFVRELTSPKQTFNPNSPLSIARAVARYLNQNSLLESKLNISTPAEFIALLKGESNP